MEMMSDFSTQYIVTPTLPPPTPPPLYLCCCFDRIHPPSLQVWWGWRGGGERKKVRLLNGVSGKAFPLHLFPCTVQDLWSCLKAYFLYRFVWLDNRLWTSLSALQQIRVQKPLFFFYCKISILSDLSFGFETLQCRSLNQMAGKQLLFHKRNLSTFCQSWCPRTVNGTAHGLGLCFGFYSFLVVGSRGCSLCKHFGLFLSTKGHLGRGHVLHTLSMIYCTLTFIALFFCCQTSNCQKKKKRKKKGGMCALEQNAHERKPQWALAESFTWCESHKPHPLSQIILRLLLIKIHTRSGPLNARSHGLSLWLGQGCQCICRAGVGFLRDAKDRNWKASRQVLVLFILWWP